MFYLLHTSFVTSEEVKNYKSLQSYKYFTSGWVLEVEWKTYSEEEIILILGKVRHSYASSKPPLHPWLLIKRSGAVIVAHCTCMAGLAKTCSHIGAVLHWVEAAVRVNMSATCTSKGNIWLMPTPKENIPFLELRQTNFSTPKKLPKRDGSTMMTASNQQSQQSSAAANCIQTPTNLEKENVFKEIAKEKNKMPSVLSLIKPYNEQFVTMSDHLPQLLPSIYDPTNLTKSYTELMEMAADFTMEEITEDNVEQLAQMTIDQSRSKQWFRYRAGRITASRFRQVIHTDPHKPSLSLLSSICYPDVQGFSNEATKWGCEHEMEALQSYKAKNAQAHHGLIVSQCGFYVSVEHPFLGASPDAFVDCECCGQGLVEIKCPLCCQKASFESTADRLCSFCLKKQPDGTLSLDCNHAYYYQCQLQLFVTKRRYCDFIVWSNSELFVDQINQDDSLIQSAMPVATKFWRMCVLPELMGKWYTRKQTTISQGQEQQQEEDHGRWCYCKEEKGGEMVGCDNKSCHIKWFHLQCVGMTVSTIPHGKWFCPTCNAMKYNGRKSTSK